MLKRLSESNFNYSELIATYKISEEKAISLLQGRVNGKTQIIKSKKILGNILCHLKCTIM